jgi:hypothetical protein
MKEFRHICDHPTCYATDDGCTIYEVQSRHGEGSFKVCGEHLMKREVDRAQAIVTANPASVLNNEVLESLKEE